jgi:hypothetical protein
MAIRALIGIAAASLLAASAPAQGTGAATPFLPIASEPPAKLIVDQPIAEPLTRGAAVIPYRTENFRILPVFGVNAVNLSPRAGHLHVTVDDLPWHWADIGTGNTVVVVGLPAGEHKVLIELALPDHHVIAGQTVHFLVPQVASHTH